MDPLTKNLKTPPLWYNQSKGGMEHDGTAERPDEHDDSGEPTGPISAPILGTPRRCADDLYHQRH